MQFIQKIKARGKIPLNIMGMINFISKFKTGTEITIKVEKTRKHRSNNQNKYYWGVIVKLIQKELAEFLVDRTGKMPRILSTSALSTAEFEVYMAKLRIWASSFLNVYIPLSNETEFNY